MNELVYSFKESNVRVIEKDGQPWFVAKDVCDVLNHTNSRVAISRLDEDEKGVSKVYTLGGYQDMSIINEFGLYTLILNSNLKEAKEFKRWITHEVIPSIRKRGIYATEDVTKQVLENPQFMIELLQSLQQERNKNKEMNDKLEQQRPQVLLAQSIENTNDLIGVGELSKIIKQNGHDIGQNRLFKWLRDNKYLMYRNGENVPTQYAMDRGWFKVIERTVNDGKEIKIKFTTKVTGKGQLYFVNKFLGTL